MGEKGNMAAAGDLFGIGSGVGSVTDVTGTPGDGTGGSGSTGHLLGVARGAAKTAAQQIQDQLAAGAADRSDIGGLPSGEEKPSGPSK